MGGLEAARCGKGLEGSRGALCLPARLSVSLDLSFTHAPPWLSAEYIERIKGSQAVDTGHVTITFDSSRRTSYIAKESQI